MTIIGAQDSAAGVPSWVADVVTAMRSEFPDGTLERGRRYADQEMVASVHTVGGGRGLFAVVRGKRQRPYHVLVHHVAGASGPAWDNSCTCPMETDCKHVVAALLEAMRSTQGHSSGPEPGQPTHLSIVPEPAIATAPRPAGPDWRRLLQPLTHTRQEGGDSEEPSTALLIEWRQPHESGASRGLPIGGSAVTLRPMRRGASGRWVRSGINWSQFRYGHHGSDAGRAALRAIDRCVTGGAYHSYGASESINLTALGAQAARLLADVAEAGVPLITPNAGQPVIVSHTAATLAVDVRAAQESGAAAPDISGQSGPLSVQVLLRHDGAMMRPDRVSLFGKPAAVLLRHADDIATGAAAPLVIAPVALPPGDVSGLLHAGRIDVPADEVDRFFTSYYPLLQRRVEVLSGDDSVEFPEPLTPRLRVRAGYGAAHALRLAWGVTYGDDEFELHGRQALRDLEGERALRERIAALLGQHVPAAISRDITGALQLRTTAELTGMQTARFTTEVLSQLADDPDVDVHVTGHAADYGPTEHAPTVHLGIRDGRDDHDIQDPGASPGSTDWFSLDVRVRLGEQDVPFRPLFAALCQGEPQLLLDSGTWFSLDLPELDQLRQLIEEARSLSDDDELRLSRWQAGLWDELADIAATTTECARWRETVGGLLDDAEREPLPCPPDLDATLRPYQLDGFRWLSYLWSHRLGGVLADDMGLGKTMQALAALEHAKSCGLLERPALVVAPTSVIDTWCREAARFAPGLRMRAVTETSARRSESLSQIAAEADVLVTSYAIVRLDAAYFQELTWGAVLLDEAQAVKNPRAKTHQVVRTLDAPTKVAITGTPLENSLQDLWALLAITAPGLFPKLAAFTDTYRKPIESGADTERLARLQRRVRPLMMRRTKESVAPELPPKQEQVMRVDLAPAHRRAYDRRLARERQRVLGLLQDFDRNRVAIFRSLTVLRQLALAPVLVDPEHARIPASKIEAFAEQIAQVAAEGHRALVFSQFTGFLRLVRERLEADGIEYAYLDGSTRNRPARIQQFRDGDAPVFLISLKAGGFGLTLTEADYVFLLDPWWNPAAEQQAVDRTHRIGQDKTVMVYRLIAADTIEDKVVALQQRKRDLFANVIDSGGTIDTMLTVDDIRGLLQE